MATTRIIDLNSDLGEAYGAYSIAPDEELFELISSANVACGFHGGDPRVMERTVAAATAHGVAVGAHPGFPDLVGFGRREIVASADEVRTDVLYQIGALDAFCRAAGVTMQHVKAHGALYNRSIKDEATAAAIAAAVKAYEPALLFVALPGSTLARAAEAIGLTVAREGFADRAYNPDGSLASRHLLGAVIRDPEVVAERAVRLILEGKLTAIDGAELEVTIDTLCLHSDTPGAVTIARAIRRRFDEAGITVRAMRER
jgi:UPF0271 protein